MGKWRLSIKYMLLGKLPVGEVETVLWLQLVKDVGSEEHSGV